MTRQFILTLLLLIPIFSFSQTSNKKDDLGRKQGLWEKHYPNGKKKYSGTFKDNYPIGEMKRYHQNGNLKAIMFFSQEGKHAQTSLYNESSLLIAEGVFVNSKKEGNWNYFDKKKNILVSENYKQGVLHGESVYRYKNGKTSESITYTDGKRDGIWKRFFDNGQIYLEAMYQKGKLSGGYQVYYKNGVIEFGGQYKNNKKEGIWEYYSDKGEVLFSIEYNDGIAINQEELDRKEQEKLKLMETQQHKLVDPANFVNDPDSYLQSLRGR